MVAADGHALRSVIPLVNERSHVEAVCDDGCQIVAMSESCAHSLSLSYDPEVKLKMQSANGGLDWTCGIARNVPFRFEDITLYFQVHVVPTPAYDVLLGRPFNVLTESVIKNFRNEDQTITITCPNSGRRVTIPSIPRGPPHHHPQNAQKAANARARNDL